MLKRMPFTAWAVLVGMLMGGNVALAVEREGAAEVLVVAISDGDTASVLLNGERQRVRLASVDAPEKGQAFGRRAEQSLRELVWKKTVSINWSGLDRYGRIVATVAVGQVDVGAEQVRRGMAWVYRAYSKDPGLLALENEAREARRGLWADPQPIAPWNWRSARRERENVRWVE